MELYLFPVLALLLIVCGRETDGYGPLAAQVYWKSMLPATPLPHALQLLLTSDAEIRSSFADGLLTIAVSSRVRYRTSYWAESKAFHKSKSTFNTTTTTTYFLQHNLHPNTKMSNVILIKSPKGFNFLPRKLAQSIPFSTSKLPEILNLTSIKSISKEAQIIKQTIQDCEAPGMEGEDKHCVTSLESLVDYVVMKFGTRVQTASNQVEEEKKKQDYIIQEGIKMMEEKNHNMICHKENYAYAVYYCHIINDTNVYMISMRGIDESRAEAAVVCHLDTSAWNPNHYAFQVLKVKPGGLPVCHFLNSDTIVWSPILGYIMSQFIGEIL